MPAHQVYNPIYIISRSSGRYHVFEDYGSANAYLAELVKQGKTVTLREYTTYNVLFPDDTDSD